MHQKSGPLIGVRVVEFEAIGPVPLAGMLLADMGAEVVQIARPKQRDQVWDDVGASVLHRGRHQVEVDLKRSPDVALKLLGKAHIVLEGFRPGVMERLGLGPERCLEINRQLVYGRMTGWGQDGPLALRAGHDINYIAQTGILHALGAPGEPPPVPLNVIGDYGGGAMFLLTGVLAALVSAQRTGKGQVVDAAMVDGVAALTSLFQAFRSTGRWSDLRGDNLLDGGAPFYRTYACSDQKFVAVGALEPAFFKSLLEGLGLSVSDYRQNDKGGWEQMSRTFAEIFSTRTRDEWTKLFSDLDACVSPVLDWEEAHRADHNRMRGTFVCHEGITQPAPAPRFSRTPSRIGMSQQVEASAMLTMWSSDI